MSTPPQPEQHHGEPDREASPNVSVGDRRTGKTRLLARQCDTCIFRPRNPMHLEPGRLHDLVAEARSQQTFIVCHDTLPAVNPHAAPAICRGFHNRYTTQALQIIGRLWGFLEVEPPGTDGASMTGAPGQTYEFDITDTVFGPLRRRERRRSPADWFGRSAG